MLGHIGRIAAISRHKIQLQTSKNLKLQLVAFKRGNRFRLFIPDVKGHLHQFSVEYERCCPHRVTSDTPGSDESFGDFSIEGIALCDVDRSSLKKSVKDLWVRVVGERVYVGEDSSAGR